MAIVPLCVCSLTRANDWNGSGTYSLRHSAGLLRLISDIPKTLSNATPSAHSEKYLPVMLHLRVTDERHHASRQCRVLSSVLSQCQSPTSLLCMSVWVTDSLVAMPESSSFKTYLNISSSLLTSPVSKVTVRMSDYDEVTVSSWNPVYPSLGRRTSTNGIISGYFSPQIGLSSMHSEFPTHKLSEETLIVMCFISIHCSPIAPSETSNFDDDIPLLRTLLMEKF